MPLSLSLLCRWRQLSPLDTCYVCSRNRLSIVFPPSRFATSDLLGWNRIDCTEMFSTRDKLWDDWLYESLEITRWLGVCSMKFYSSILHGPWEPYGIFDFRSLHIAFLSTFFICIWHIIHHETFESKTERAIIFIRRKYVCITPIIIYHLQLRISNREAIHYDGRNIEQTTDERAQDLNKLMLAS